MISTNRYICIAAAAVYGGRAMDLVERPDATEQSGPPDETEQKQNEEAVAQYMKEHAGKAPTASDIGAISHAVFTWEQMTFGNANAKAGFNKFKAFFGRGRALTNVERGVVGSAIWFANKKLSTLTKLDPELNAACLHVVHELRNPTKWDNANTKKITQFAQKSWTKHHCRLTGKVRADDQIGMDTGVKLSKKTYAPLNVSAESAVITIFEAVGFGPLEVKQVMSGENIDFESKIGMLTKVIEHDTFLESAVSRQLLEDVLQHQQNNRSTVSQAFDELKPALIGTPIYHFLVKHKFRALTAETPTGVDQWPPCLLVKPEQAGVDAGEVKKASKAIAADKAGWKRWAIVRFFARAAKLLDRGYSVYRFHGTTATFNFTHERNGVVRAKSKALWFSAEVQGSTDPAFVQMSESSLVQPSASQWTVGGVSVTIYIIGLVFVIAHCHPAGFVILGLTAVAAIIVAAIQHYKKNDMKSDVERLTEQVALLTSDKHHLLAAIGTQATVTYRDGVDGTDVGHHHIEAVTRNDQRQENTARPAAVALVAQRLTAVDYGTETELPQAQKTLVRQLEATYGNLELNEKQTLASALLRNNAQNAGELIASLNDQFNTI